MGLKHAYPHLLADTLYMEIVRFVERWHDSKWSQKTAQDISRLMFVYKEAIDATYRFKQFNIVRLGDRSGHSWIEALSSLFTDIVSVFGLLAILKFPVPLWATIFIAVSWIMLLDRAAKLNVFGKLADPLIRRLVLQRYKEWTNSTIVIGPLVRDEVTRHIRINLNKIGGFLSNGLSIAKQQNIAGHAHAQREISRALERALGEVKAVRDNILGFAPTASTWSKILDKIPLKETFLAAPILSILLWILYKGGGIALCLVWVFAYNFLAVIGLAFYDSAIRKEVLFDRTSVQASDGITLPNTPVSGAEREIYAHLEVAAPSVEPWALSVWPRIHYSLTVIMVILTYVFWDNRFSPILPEKIVVGVFGLDLMVFQIWFFYKSFRR